MDTETKNILQSKTFWASIAVVICSVLTMFHRMPADLQANDIADLLTSGAAAVAGIAAIVGRIIATKKVTVLPQGGAGDSGSATKGLLILLVCLFVVAPVGCANSETNRVAQSIVATTAHARIALQLHEQHVTTPAQEEVIETMLVAEAKAEDAYYEAIKAGDSVAMKNAKAAFAAAVAATKAELDKYPITLPPPIVIPPAPPATRPTN